MEQIPGAKPIDEQEIAANVAGAQKPGERPVNSVKVFPKPAEGAADIGAQQEGFAPTTGTVVISEQ